MKLEKMVLHFKDRPPITFDVDSITDGYIDWGFNYKGLEKYIKGELKFNLVLKMDKPWPLPPDAVLTDGLE